MKIKLQLNISGILVEIEEEGIEGDIFEFLTNLINFYEKNSSKITSISPIITPKTITPEIKKEIKSEDVPLVFNEKTQKLANESKISPQKLIMIYDFGAETDVPPLLYEFDVGSKVEKQRFALVLLLFANYVINDQDTLTSQFLTPLLTKSNIDPSNLFNVSKSPEFKKWVTSDGRKYRITDPGKIKAKQLLKEIENSI